MTARNILTTACALVLTCGGLLLAVALVGGAPW